MHKIKLFALPFAGGSKYSYNTFNQYMPDYIDFKPIEIPGRGERMGEELEDDIHKVAEDVFQQIKNELNEPYAIYGHSMGTILTYLVCKKIVENGLNTPEQIIVTGAGGPSFKDRERERHLLSNKDFKQKLIDYGGSPKEVLDNAELYEFFEPILRNDFKAVETYYYQDWNKKFDFPITVAIGLSEPVSVEDAKLWEKETTDNVSIRQFPGGHFFIYDYTLEMVKVIAKSLSNTIK